MKKATDLKYFSYMLLHAAQHHGAGRLPDPSGSHQQHTQPGDIPNAIARIAVNNPDFLYHIGSTFTLQQIDIISSNAMAHGMPMFSSTESAFRKGEVLLGLISPLAGIGQVSAFQAGLILFHGKRAGDLPTPTLTRHSVLINMKAARALKLYPPMKLLQFAEIAG